jgi:hypothetical protein
MFFMTREQKEGVILKWERFRTADKNESIPSRLWDIGDAYNFEKFT